MEKKKINDDSLMKSRSTKACITTGYHLYMGSFRRIFRQTWIPFLVYALISGILTSYVTVKYPELLAGLYTGKATWADAIWSLSVMGGTLLLFLLATFWCIGCGCGLLRQHRQDNTIHQAAKWHGLGQLSPLRSLGWAFKRVFQHIKALFSHFGLVFSVLFIVAVFTLLALLLTTLPAIILAIANSEAQTGVLMGDPLGMPGYMTSLTLVVFTVAGFIQAYILLSALFPTYYIYGSAVTQEKERNEKKNSLYRP